MKPSVRGSELKGQLMSSYRFTRAVCFVCGLVLFVGCAGKREPPPFSAPPLQTSAIHFVGSALSGVTGAKPAASARSANVPRVRVTFVALEQAPTSVGSPLGTHLRLVVADGSNGPILPSPLLTRDVRLMEPEGENDPLAALAPAIVGRRAIIAEMQGMLAPGITAAFEVYEPADAGAMALDRQQRRIEVSVRQIQGSPLRLEYALMVDDHPAERLPSEIDRLSSSTGAQSSPAPTTRPAMQRELALFDRPAAGSAQCIILVIPSAFGMAQAIAAVVEVLPGADDDPSRQLLASALRQADEAAAGANRRLRIARSRLPKRPASRS